MLNGIYLNRNSLVFIAALNGRTALIDESVNIFLSLMSVLQILCIHLKRFKHEMYFSSKINHFISFPLTGLDMKPFLVKGL